MEKATREHFFHHHDKAYAHRRDGCHWCQLRSFPRHKSIPVSVINDTGDKAVLPKDFRFINENVIGKGVQLPEDSFRVGCTCTEGDDCKYDGCSCLADQDDDEEDEEMDSGGARRAKYRYYDTGPDVGLLRPEFLDSQVPIYECHDACSCSKDCPNRVVERGRTIPLQIFRTDDGRGWGVRTLRDIRQGQFVDRYVGEVITPEEANKRRAASHISKKKDVYLFGLDKFNDPKSLDPRLSGDPVEVDGEFMSGPTRFVNHSCDPNMRIFARVGSHAELHLHDLALFAVKDIPANAELTFDYVDGKEDEEEPSNGDKNDMTKCKCGSPKCRGYLW